MTRFSNDSLQIHGILNGGTPMAAALTFRAVRSIRHDLGLTSIGPDSGAPYHEVKFIGEEKPQLAAPLVALETLLDTLSLLGTNCLTADGTHPGVRAFLQSHNACAANARTAGSNHGQITVAKAQLVISQLGGSVGQTAEAQLLVHCLSTDGVERPTATVYNAALPTSFIADEEFVIGAPTIAGIAIAADHIQSWQLDTGLDLVVITAAGSTKPTVVDLRKIAPVFTVAHDDASLLDDAKIPQEGIECAHADTFFPLHKRNPFGGLYDPDEEEHILLTAAGFAKHSKHYDASGSATGTGELMIECIEGVGGVPLTATTGTALTGS